MISEIVSSASRRSSVGQFRHQVLAVFARDAGLLNEPASDLLHHFRSEGRLLDLGGEDLSP
jgi:hypothetical protein